MKNLKSWQSKIRKCVPMGMFFLFCFQLGLVHAQTQVVWSEDFEGNWSRTWGADAGTWEGGVPTSGPGKAYSGQNCIATALTGNYSEWVDSRLIRESFQVPDASENPRLRYWQWFSFSSDDKGFVEIRIQDSSWTVVSEEIWNTSSGRWSYASIDLVPYAGKVIQVAFHFISRADTYYDYTTTHVSSGWYIDDISLQSGPVIFMNQEGWEMGISEWSVDKGTWQIGEPSSGPNTAHSGLQCAGTVIDDNYSELVDSRLTSPKFTVPAEAENPRFRFWHWFNFSADDYGFVEITEDGKLWQKVSIDYLNYSSRWTYALLDLKKYAGKSIKIAFHFISRSITYYDYTRAHVSSGWYIDDMFLETGPYAFNSPENWKEGIGDWSVEHGTWQVGVPKTGPSTAYSDSICAGTILDGNYEENVDSRIVSPVFTVPLAEKNPRLRFFHWYNFSSDDSAFVEVKVDTNKWEKILGPYVNTSSNAWTSPPSCDLKRFAGQQIQVGFRFSSKALTHYNYTYTHVSTGWYIDDIEIDGYTSIPGSDNTDPLVSAVTVSPTPTVGAASVTLSALLSDVGRGDSKIARAEYYINHPATPGSGASMAAQDGAFDSSLEQVTATIPVSLIGTANSTHTLYVRGNDEYGNWSALDSVTVQVTLPAVSRQFTIPDTTGTRGGQITIPIYASNWEGIAGAEFKLVYDPVILSATAIRLPAAMDGFSLQDSLAAGACAVSLARATALGAGSGPLLLIDFEVLNSAAKGDTTTIRFSLAHLYDENALLMTNLSFEPGLFTAGESTELQTLARLWVTPGSDTLSLPGSLSLTAAGEDSKGQSMAVAPAWQVVSLFGSIGTVDTAEGPATTFTATGPGDGLIIANQEGKADTAIIVAGKTRGDINLDGGDVVNTQDAILGLQFINKNRTPHLYQSWAADYDGSGQVLENDMLQILYAALGTMMPKTGVYAQPALVFQGEPVPRSDGLIEIPVLARNRPDLAAAGVEIVYDHDQIVPVAAAAGTSSSLIVSNFDNLDDIRVSVLNTDAIVDGAGVWLRLLFRAKTAVDEITPLQFRRVRLFDRAGQPVAVEFGCSDQFVAQLPQTHQLFQNHPNPFNPGTLIRFDLAAPAHVQLDILNIRGQKVAELVNGTRTAGAHVAPWDGRDAEANTLPAGIYFCRMVVDHGRWSKISKMSLIK